MATIAWIGAAQNQKKTGTITIVYDAATTYSVAIPIFASGKVVSTVGVTDAAGTAAALYALLIASEEPEFQEITWSYPGSGAVISFVENTAGLPVTIAVDDTGGAGTITLATTITGIYRSDANYARNWSSNTVPTTGDTVVFELSDVPCLYNLESVFAAEDITAVIVRDTYTGRIANPIYNPRGYREYRGTTLVMQTCTTLTVDLGGNTTPERFKFATGTNQTTVLIKNGGGSLGAESVWFRGAHASNAMTIDGGSVALANENTNTATIATLNALNAAVSVSSGVTLTTANLTDSILNLNANATTITLNGSTSRLITNGSVTITTLTANEGLVTHNSNGTITTATLGTGATLDTSGDRRAKTITNVLNMHTGSRFNDPDGVIVCAAGIQPVECRLGEISLEVGNGRLIDVGNVF